MIKNFVTTLISFILLVFSTNLYSAEDHLLYLKSGTYTLPSNVDRIDFSQWERYQFGLDFYVYIHFDQIPSNDEKVQLQEFGITLFDYVPAKWFLAKVKENTDVSQISSFHIDAVVPVLPEYKLSNQLANANYPDYALVGRNILLEVQTYPGVSSLVMEKVFEGIGAAINSSNATIQRFSISLDVEKIGNLAAHPLVKYIETIDSPADPEDITGQSLHRSNFISNPALNSVPFNGAGVWLAIGDDGEIGPHIDFTGRVDQSNASASFGDHGDHVAGIMNGAGNLDPEAQGMAWGADLMVYDVWDAVYSTPTSYVNPGVVVTSTSYGNGCNAGYTSFTQLADQQIRQMPNLMHVFSAGNSGGSDCGYGAGAGWGNITGGIKSGKNVIAVGNVTYLDALAGSSSRGPATDGRIKPDICAVGTNVWSCQPNNTYDSFTGTSMAAPGVSGTYGQLVHAYRELNNGQTPPSALVKGAMLNTADDLGNVGPDFRYGWGRLNARRVVEVFENNSYFSGSVSQNSQNSHSLSIPAGVDEVKIMVYWNDYEGSTVSSLALVNNLDMTVTTPSSTTLFPYVLDPTPNSTALNTPATNGVDNLNNVEQVVITSPASGTYSIDISGTVVPQGPQTYYVIYEFLTNEIVVTYPTGGEGFAPGTTETIRWDAVASSGNFTLEYSINDGVTWNTINSNVSSNTRSYNWNVPNAVTGKALIKVSRNGVSGQSQLPFSIIGVPTNIQVSSSCPTAFEVTWNTVPGATSYEVSVLGSKYMDSVLTTTTNSATLNGFPSTNNYWISVKAKTTDAIGKRAIAVEKVPGIWNCPLDDDIEVSALKPSGSILVNCDDYSQLPITVQLKNNGQNTVTSVPMAFQFNSLPIQTEQWNGSLLPGDSVIFIFSQTVNMNTLGNYSLDIWKTTSDDNVFNDSVLQDITVISGTTINLPYVQDFESFSTCPVTTNCGGTICTLGGGWKNMENGLNDDIDFRVNNGTTVSQGTGPSADHTIGNAIGNYVYLEASGNCEFQEAQLLSPCIDLSNSVAPHASIWYHMLGTNVGQLHVDVLSEGRWFLNVVQVISGNQGSNWNELDIDLSPFSGTLVVIRFRGITGDGWSSDIALDDFNVFETEMEASIIADSVACIFDGSVTITNGPSGLANSFSWNFGTGANPSTATTSGPHSVQYSSPGIKTITLIVSDGTASDTATSSIQIFELPQPSFSAVYNPAADSMEFSNTSTDYSSLLWDFGDGATSTDVNPMHRYASKGYYNVSLTLTNICGDTTLTQSVENFPAGIQSGELQEFDFMVFPNPNNGQFAIRLLGYQNQSVQIRVFDANGKTILVNTVVANQSETETLIDMNQVSKGIYFVEIQSQKSVLRKRIVVQ